MKQKTLVDLVLIGILGIAATAAAIVPEPVIDSKQAVEVQFVSSPPEPAGAFVRTGVIEFTEQNGKKAYWITGKSLKELVRQYNAQVH